MKLSYNNKDWDKTDTAEVDLVNKAIETSFSPITAMDAVTDAGSKLLYSLEKDASLNILYKCQEDKLLLIIDNLFNLIDRLVELPFDAVEDSRFGEDSRLVKINSKITNYQRRKHEY